MPELPLFGGGEEFANVGGVEDSVTGASNTARGHRKAARTREVIADTPRSHPRKVEADLRVTLGLKKRITRKVSQTCGALARLSRPSAGSWRIVIRTERRSRGWAGLRPRLLAKFGVGMKTILLPVRSRARSLIGTTCAVLFLDLLSCAESDWPQYRGPNRTGVTDEKSWLESWPAEGPTVAWRAKVGLGFSSMIVARGRVATAGHDKAQDTVYCFDAVSGKSLWKHSYAAELGDKYFEGGTTGSPTFDGENLYWLSRWGDLFCLGASDGKIIWSKNIAEETKAPIPTWGFSGAPLVHENLLVLNVGDAGIALDKSNGKIVWKSAEKDAGYSSPLPLQRNGDWLALFSNAESYLAVNLKTGQEVWRFRWLTEYGVNAADPIVSGDRIFISTGYGKGATLINLASGKPEQEWKNKSLRTQLNPSVLVDGYLYGVDGDTTTTATLKCLELATGTEKWAQAGFGSGGVIAASGKLIALSGSGELIVAPASPSGFKPIARFQILGGKCWTAPVLANGFIYCRNSRGDLAVADVRKR